jgi:hypothetical protein
MSPPEPPENIYTLVGWPGYHELFYQWLVGRRGFQHWDDIDMFKVRTGGWCYLNLISTSPTQATNFARTRGMTMNWMSIIPLARAAGNGTAPFALRHTSDSTSHITMSAGGTWNVDRVEWILRNPTQATPEQRALVGAVIGAERVVRISFHISSSTESATSDQDALGTTSQ